MATKKGKGSETGAIGDEPQEIPAEDAVGAAETPTERQQEREQAIVEEPVAESEQRIAEATEPAKADSKAAMGPAEEEAGAPAEDTPAEPVAPEDAPQPVAEAEQDEVEAAATEQDPAEPAATDDEAGVGDQTPRQKPVIPGMDLEVDIVREGEEVLRNEYGYPIEDEDEEGGREDGDEELLPQPITATSIDLAAGARYTATGKRKTACARVILKPGKGAYSCNGRSLEEYFPRATVQRNIRQALETVGLEEKMDVVASIHGGGMTAQAGALRHGISRALVEADPNLRSELKRRGFLTRDPRVKERKKAGLKKARKRPQFSKR